MLLAVHVDCHLIEKKLKTEKKTSWSSNEASSYSRKAVNRGLKQANGDVLSFLFYLNCYADHYLWAAAPLESRTGKMKAWEKSGPLIVFISLDTKRPKKAPQRRAAISQLVLRQKKKKSISIEVHPGSQLTPPPPPPLPPPPNHPNPPWGHIDSWRSTRHRE